MYNSILPFEPHPLVPGGVLQTIVASQFTGEVPRVRRTLHRVPVAPRTKLALFEQKAVVPDAPMVLLMHGMGGCSESGYIRRLAHRLAGEDFHVFLMNHRGCGPGMGMAERLWNGGSSEDLAEVVDYIVRLYPGRPMLLAGFSLSGNVLLKYLGEGRKVPDSVHSALAVNPPVDLEISSRAISEGPLSGLFNRYYLNLMHRQADALTECFPGAYRPSGRARTIYEFDVEYTAPAANYSSVEDYYTRCSSRQFLKHIRIPTTILSAKDDPFVPAHALRKARKNAFICLADPDHGGHMGYLSKGKTPLGDHRWMDYVCMEWVARADLDIRSPRQYTALSA